MRNLLDILGEITVITVILIFLVALVGFSISVPIGYFKKKSCQDYAEIFEKQVIYRHSIGCYELIDNKWQKVDL